MRRFTKVSDGYRSIKRPRAIGTWPADGGDYVPKLIARRLFHIEGSAMICVRHRAPLGRSPLCTRSSPRYAMRYIYGTFGEIGCGEPH